MPLTKKGNKIMASMKAEYGSKKAKQVFYASRNTGKVKGVDRSKKKNPKQTKKINPVLSAAGKKGQLKKRLLRVVRGK